METRLERNKRRKKINTRKKIKLAIICSFFLLFLFAISIVNQSIIDLDCFGNSTIFKINVDSKTIELFGKTYNIDVNKIKKLLEDRFFGLFVLHKDFYLL